MCQKLVYTLLQVSKVDFHICPSVIMESHNAFVASVALNLISINYNIN